MTATNTRITKPRHASSRPLVPGSPRRFQAKTTIPSAVRATTPCETTISSFASSAPAAGEKPTSGGTFAFCTGYALVRRSGYAFNHGAPAR